MTEPIPILSYATPKPPPPPYVIYGAGDYAPLWRRLLAMLIDVLVLMIVCLLITMAALLITRRGMAAALLPMVWIGVPLLERKAPPLPLPARLADHFDGPNFLGEHRAQPGNLVCSEDVLWDQGVKTPAIDQQEDVLAFDHAVEAFPGC